MRGRKRHRKKARKKLQRPWCARFYDASRIQLVIDGVVVGGFIGDDVVIEWNEKGVRYQ